MSNPAPNKNVPAVPQPFTEVGSLAYVAKALKEGMDSLSGQRGLPTDRAVTFNDLIAYGVLTATQVGNAPSPSSAAARPYVVTGFSGPGALANSQVILAHQFAQQVTFYGNFGAAVVNAQSYIGALVAATSAAIFQIQICQAASDPTVAANWRLVGTATFSRGGFAATLSASQIVFAQGDRIRVIGPASADATLAGLYATLVGVWLP